ERREVVIAVAAHPLHERRWHRALHKSFPYGALELRRTVFKPLRSCALRNNALGNNALRHNALRSGAFEAYGTVLKALRHNAFRRYALRHNAFRRYALRRKALRSCALDVDARRGELLRC